MAQIRANSPIFLAQSDTTIGLLCEDFSRLNLLKKRAVNKPCIACVSDFFKFQNLARVPKDHKNRIRRSYKTSFILPRGVGLWADLKAEISKADSIESNSIESVKFKSKFFTPKPIALRVVRDCAHFEFLEKFSFLYSSSANLHKKELDLFWAISAADFVEKGLLANLAKSNKKSILKDSMKNFIKTQKKAAPDSIKQDSIKKDSIAHFSKSQNLADLVLAKDSKELKEIVDSINLCEISDKFKAQKPSRLFALNSRKIRKIRG